MYRPRRESFLLPILVPAAALGVLGGLVAVLLIRAGSSPEEEVSRVVRTVLVVALLGGVVRAMFSIGAVRAFHLEAEGLRIERAWLGDLRLPWSEVERLETSHAIGWLRSGEFWSLHRKSGGRVRILVEGLPEAERGALFRTLQERVRPGVPEEQEVRAPGGARP